MLLFFIDCSFTRWVFRLIPASAFALFFFAPQTESRAQTEPVVQWINDQGQDGRTVLNNGSNFITSFKGTNDVTVKLLSGSVNSIFQEVFTVGGANINNPAFLTNFVGLTGNGTGDGNPSRLKCIETALGGTVVLEFDFAIPLTANDRLVIADVDTGEEYSIVASFQGSLLLPSQWDYASYSGETSQLPDSSWPVWDSNGGTLTAGTTANLSEPLSVFAPKLPMDRVVVTRFNQGNGSIALQFVNLTTASGPPVLNIQSVGGNAVLSWPASFPDYSLYTATNLAPPAPWTLVGQPTLNSSQLIVTNSPAVRARFYRLQHQ